MFKANILHFIAGRHITGSLEDAGKICVSLASLNISTTLSVWTDAKEDRSSVTKKYINIINFITNNNLNSYISIKLSAIGFDTDCFKDLAHAASENNIRIHIDSLSPELSTKSMEFLKRALPEYRNMGYTIPSRWLRSIADAEELAELKIPAVRIVKGQWHDTGNIKINVKENYLKLVKSAAGRIPSIAVATHDANLAKNAIEIIKKTGSNCEIEQLFSLPLNGKKLALKKAVNYRLYIAFGSPYIPYNLTFMPERPAMIGWLVRDLFNLKPKFNYPVKYGHLQGIEENEFTKN